MSKGLRSRRQRYNRFAMVRWSPEVEAFELRWMRDYPLDLERSIRIVEALYEQARILGALQRRDPREGLEQKIRFARAINGLRTPHLDRQSPG